MHDLGYLMLMAALVTASFAAVASVVGHLRGFTRLQHAGYAASFAVTGLVTTSALALIYLFVAGDFSIKAVQHYSDRSMPMFYLLTAIWGGQEGSLLFWAWVLSLYGAAALWLNREHVRLIPYATAVINVSVLFFLFLLVFVANPFETFLGAAPTDGRGLNPLLQNPYMAIHPPTLYLGYIGMTIPFAFGLAAMASGQLDETWLRLTRRWTLAAWFFLGIGLILGKLWAYEELGWGGYWAWDPVENAGLLPWLTCTAFLHSVMIQERRGMFRKWNMNLVIISFVFTLLGTFLTRSGVVQSVHSFAESNIGNYFLIFVGLVLAVSYGLLWWRRRELSSPMQMESLLSREFAFSMNNWIFLGMAFFVFIATIFPSLSAAIVGEKITVGPPFFNTWMVPLGLVLLFLTGVGPLISWRKASGDSLRRQFLWPAGLGAVGGVIALALGAAAGGVATVLTYALAAFVFGTILQEFVRGARVRMRNAGENVLEALVGLMSRAKRRYGGYIIHFGVVLMFFGWAGNAFKSEKDVTLKRGEVASIGRYQIRYDDLRFAETPHRGEVTAQLDILDTAGLSLGRLAPARWIYRKSEQPTTEVSIRSTLIDDLYLVLAGWDPASGEVMLRLVINPFTMWVWLGSGFLILGMVVVMWPDRHKRRHLGSGGRAAAAGAVALAVLLLGPGVAEARPSTRIQLPPNLEEVAVRINNELVCLCGDCERLIVAECTCGFAQNMREDIRTRLSAGATREDVLQYFVAKQGSEVLASPPDTAFNRLAWAVPYAALGMGGIGLLIAGRAWSRRARQPPGADGEPPAPDGLDLSADQEAEYRDRLQDELEELD